MELNYSQRKALRRIGRGQSVNKGMLDDPIISKCYTVNAPPQPKDLNIVDYCDWVAIASYAYKHLQITPYGKELLDTLENSV